MLVQIVSFHPRYLQARNVRPGELQLQGVPCKMVPSLRWQRHCQARGLEFYIRGRRPSEHLCGGTTIILIRDVSEQILSINLSIKKGFSH